ncbi:MAG: hypothetical protein ACR2QM_02305 [Longimicrobiales bacterium]
MKRRLSMARTRWIMLLAALSLGVIGCAPSYVGVYGTPAYGPYGVDPWSGYPHPGAYPPGGGIFVGVPICCEDEEQEQEDAKENDPVQREP